MIIIEEQFNGPIGSGHGGTAAGRFAAVIAPHGAEVRFHRPVPLGTPMHFIAGNDRAEILNAGDHVATVRALGRRLDVGQFGRLSSTAVEAAERCWLDRRGGAHMAPTCYACGHQRAGSPGLGLRPGPVAGTALFATSWRPGVDGAVPAETIWAALDCPSGFPALHRVDVDHAVVTGELAVEIRSAVPGDADYQLLARTVEAGGRKIRTEAALIDEAGRALAVARATWIAVAVGRVLPRTGADVALAA